MADTYVLNGMTYSRGPDGQFHAAAPSSPVQMMGGITTKAPNTLDVQGKTLGNQKAGIDVTKDTATLPYDIARARAEATTADIGAKTAQINLNTLQGNIPGDPSKSGDAYRQSLPLGIRNLADAMGQGKMTSAISRQNPMMQQAAQAAMHLYPGFDANLYNERLAAMKNGSVGQLGKSGNAIGTAILHAGLSSDAAKGTAGYNGIPGLPFTGPMINGVVNAFNHGSPGLTVFHDTQHKFGAEEASAYNMGSAGERDANGDVINQDLPDASKQAAVKNAIHLLAGKQAQNLQQYNFGVRGPDGKPSLDLLDPQVLAAIKKIDPSSLAYFSTQHDPTYLALHGGVAPPPGGGTPPGGTPSLNGGPAPTGPVPAGATVATGATRNEPVSPELATQIESMVKANRPISEINAYWKAASGDPHAVIDPDQLKAVQAALVQDPNYSGFVHPSIQKPNSALTQFSGSPGGSLANGYVSGATAGLNDEASAGISTLLGNGNYSDNLAKFNGAKQVMAAANPTANTIGNIAGGLVGTLAGGAALGGAAPGLSAAIQGSKYGGLAGDAAYGALYGAGENNDNRLGGAVAGGVGGLAGGMGARAAGRVIAPAAGAASELYANGVLPTIGQRAGMAGGMFGRAINNTEQAMGSIPFLGAAVRNARQASKDQFQVGGWNQALSPLEGTGLPSSLPKGMEPGTDAQSFVSDTLGNAYDKARSGMQFVADPQFGHDVGQFQQSLADGTLNSNQVGQINQAINASLKGRVNGSVMNGDNYKAAVSDLGRKAQAWGSNPNDAAMAPYLSNFVGHLDSAASRNSSPEAVNLLNAADNGWAQFARLRDATNRGGVANKDAGTFSPTDLINGVKSAGGGIKSSAYNQGDAFGQSYAEAGRGLIDTLPNSGTPDRLMTAGGLMTLGAPAAIAHNPALLGPLAMYAPGLVNVGKRAIAPNSVRLPPWLAGRADMLGNGIYNNSGMFAGAAVPAMLGGAGD